MQSCNLQLKRTFLSGRWCWLERHALQSPQALRQTLLHHYCMAAVVVGEDDRKLQICGPSIWHGSTEILHEVQMLRLPTKDPQ